MINTANFLLILTSFTLFGVARLRATTIGSVRTSNFIALMMMRWMEHESGSSVIIILILDSQETVALLNLLLINGTDSLVGDRLRRLHSILITVLPHKLRWAMTTVRLSYISLLVCFPSISTT